MTNQPILFEAHDIRRGGRGKLDKLLSGKSATRNALRWA